jgi:hypothetical protein
MQPIGMRLVMQREKAGDVRLVIPAWISDNWGELLLFQFDGNALTIQAAE